MSNSGRLPTASEAQTIGFKAEKCFVARCPEAWLAKNVDGTDDFGVDYQVQTLQNSQVTDLFRVQLKGTTVPDLSADGSHFSIQLKAPTIRYYARFTEPILLVLCDLSAHSLAINCPLYHVWIHDELRRLNAHDLPEEQLFVTLRVPKVNSLDSDTDLSKELAQFRALANIGASLDMTLEKHIPTMVAGERVALIEKLQGGFSTRSAALMESLSEEPATVWPDRPFGSMAWFLFEAEKDLNSGMFMRAAERLVSAGALLHKAVPLEVAEYWHLIGRENLSRLCQHEACEAFDKAMEAVPGHPKYLAAWAETKFNTIFSERGHVGVSAILARLTSSEPAVLSIKARILVAENRFDEAEQALSTFSGVERLSALAIIYTMRSQLHEALAASEEGLLLPDLKEGTRILLLIIKARAQFNIAVNFEPEAENGRFRLPLTGKPGANLNLVHDAWNGMKIAAEGLRASGWPLNIEFLADIMCAASSILDREEEALAILKDAADKRPTLPMLQAAVESLAAQTGDFDLALSSNAMQPQNGTTRLRKTAMLHATKRDAECAAFFEAQLPTLNRADPMFGEALISAVTSADRLVRADLVEAWLPLFEQSPELSNQRAVWDYARIISKNKAKRGEALNELFDNFENRGKPVSLAIHLFHALNPHRSAEAEKIVAVAPVLVEDRLLPVESLLQLGQAYTTLGRWTELLAVAEDGRERFIDNSTFTAVAALAMDRLGRTAEARGLLIPLIEQGIAEPFVLTVHIDIAIRCGFLDEAMAVTEKLQALSLGNDKKIEHLKLLHHLVRAKNPADPRAHSIAWRIGELIDPNDEINEGSFLMMIMTSPHPAKSDSRQVAEYQARLKRYSTTFPDSKILRMGSFADDATPEEMLQTLMRMVGDTPESIEKRRQQEDSLNEKAKGAPFSWRPHINANLGRDIPAIWEASKTARGAEKSLSLQMISGNWQPCPPDKMRDRVPLMDHLSLLIAQDLDLIDLIFKIFPRVAVSQRTMLEIGRLSDPVIGSFAYEKCRSIQTSLQKHFGQLLQPRSPISDAQDDGIHSLQIAAEIQALSKQSPYILYSDDAIFKIYCQGHDSDFERICVLDILATLESDGLITAREVAKKVGRLCSWGVGIAVQQGWQIASLPVGLSNAENVKAGEEILHASELCIAIFNGMWDRPGQTYREMLAHAASLTATMVLDDAHSSTSIAALMAVWHEKAMLALNPPPNAGTSLALLATKAAMSLPLSYNDDSGSRKLWRSYQLLLERFRPEIENAVRVVDGLIMIASAAINNDIKPESFRRRSMKTFFCAGLADGSSTKRAFQTSCKLWQERVLRKLGGAAVFINTWMPADASKPEYWRCWTIPNDETSLFRDPAAQFPMRIDFDLPAKHG